jgi:hypothetical protein
MNSIKLKSHVDSNGMLHISLPDLQNTDVDITIVYQPLQKEEKRKWSPEFLSTFGAWQGELERAPQEEQPEREPLL